MGEKIKLILQVHLTLFLGPRLALEDPDDNEKV